MFGFYDKYFTFFGLDIAYYGLIIACAMGLGVFIACKNAKFRGLTTDDLVIVACYALPLSIVGARLYYVLFSLDQFTSFWQVFKIWEGGMAIYGGVIGGALGIMIYCLIHKKNFFDVTDVIIPSLILGQAMGRWGNFINQEAYGYAVTKPSMQWFPFSVYIEHCNQAGCTCGGSGWHLATFFYESLWNLIAFVILILLLRKRKMKYRGSLSAFYLIIYGIGRAWIEGLRTDSLYMGSIRVSQFLSILLIIAGLVILVVNYILHKKGKIKSLKELQPVYDFALQNKEKNDKERKAQKELKKKEKTKFKDIDINIVETDITNKEKTINDLLKESDENLQKESDSESKNEVTKENKKNNE